LYSVVVVIIVMVMVIHVAATAVVVVVAALLVLLLLPGAGPRNLYGRDGKFRPTFKSGTEKRLFYVPLLMI